MSNSPKCNPYQHFFLQGFSLKKRTSMSNDFFMKRNPEPWRQKYRKKFQKKDGKTIPLKKIIKFEKSSPLKKSG